MRRVRASLTVLCFGILCLSTYLSADDKQDDVDLRADVPPPASAHSFLSAVENAKAVAENKESKYLSVALANGGGIRPASFHVIQPDWRYNPATGED